MRAEQSYKNHTRLDPAFHFFLTPIFLINLFVALGVAWKTVHLHPFEALWGVVMAGALLALVTLARTYALKVQDRVIRLEERLRLATLATPADTLSPRQLIALRFASDAEVPTLARRASTETLSAKQIKEAIVQWRADNHRV